MRFPNTNRKAFILFWAIVIVALLLFGIMVERFAELGSGPHPVLLFIRRIYDADVNMLGLLLGRLFIGFAVFDVWAILTVMVFMGLSCFDRDLVTHIWSGVDRSAEYRLEFRRPEVKDVAYKAMILAVISGVIGLLLLSFILLPNPSFQPTAKSCAFVVG